MPTLSSDPVSDEIPMDKNLPHIKLTELPVVFEEQKGSPEGSYSIEVMVRYNAGAYSTPDEGYIHEIYAQLKGPSIRFDFPEPQHVAFEDAEYYAKQFCPAALKSLAASKNHPSRYMFVVHRILQTCKLQLQPVGNLRLIRDVLGVEVYEDENQVEFVAQPDGSLVYDWV